MLTKPKEVTRGVKSSDKESLRQNDNAPKGAINSRSAAHGIKNGGRALKQDTKNPGKAKLTIKKRNLTGHMSGGNSQCQTRSNSKKLEQTSSKAKKLDQTGSHSKKIEHSMDQRSKSNCNVQTPIPAKLKHSKISSNAKKTTNVFSFSGQQRRPVASNATEKYNASILDSQNHSAGNCNTINAEDMSRQSQARHSQLLQELKLKRENRKQNEAKYGNYSKITISADIDVPFIQRWHHKYETAKQLDTDFFSHVPFIGKLKHSSVQVTSAAKGRLNSD